MSEEGQDQKTITRQLPTREGLKKSIKNIEARNKAKKATIPTASESTETAETPDPTSTPTPVESPLQPDPNFKSTPTRLRGFQIDQDVNQKQPSETLSKSATGWQKQQAETIKKEKGRLSRSQQY